MRSRRSNPASFDRMKITRIETIPVRVPIKPELAIRGGRGLSHSVSPFLLVKIHTDEGIVGVGEASCTPRWSGEDQVTAAHFIDRYFAPLLVGETLDDIERLNVEVRRCRRRKLLHQGSRRDGPVGHRRQSSRQAGVGDCKSKTTRLRAAPRPRPCQQSGRFPASNRQRPRRLRSGPSAKAFRK